MDNLKERRDMDIQKKENNTLSTLYPDASIGTEGIGQEDLNTPTLKIVQPNTQDIENKKDGSYYRSDLKEQFDDVEVNLVLVTTAEVENYNKTGLEKVKIYFGFYAGTNEPFKMYVRGWGLASHRDFQTEIANLKHRFNVPMLAFNVNLTTEKQSGTIQDTGKPYTTYKPVFTVVKDANGTPLIEKDLERIKFLVEASKRFSSISQNQSDNDIEQNEVPEVDIDEIPEFMK